MKMNQLVGVLSMVSLLMVGCAKPAANPQTDAENDAAASTATNAQTEVQTEPVGADAVLIAEGFGWQIYREYTGNDDCTEMCRIYIESADTHERRLLLETHGENQQGTMLSIKTRNRLAYGGNDITYKDSATYENGYICAVDEAVVLSATKVLLNGIPDCRNYYSYLYDLETNTAIHIEAYSGFAGVTERNGKTYLQFATPDYSGGVREEVYEIYDMDGNLIK